MMAEDVDDPLVAKERERPVDRCEPDPAPAAPETSVELLRRHVVGLDELAENRHALRGRTNPVPLEQPLGPLTPPTRWNCLLRRHLVASLAVDGNENHSHPRGGSERGCPGLWRLRR